MIQVSSSRNPRPCMPLIYGAKPLLSRMISHLFIAVKSTQTVFNGYGAQETCNMLVEALIYPTMSTASVCSDEDIWNNLDFCNAPICVKRLTLSIQYQGPLKGQSSEVSLSI
jgi:hypothetical protein